MHHGYNEIEKEKKNGEFVDFTDFVVRCYSQSLNKKSIISLVLAGCFQKDEMYSLADTLERYFDMEKKNNA